MGCAFASLTIHFTNCSIVLRWKTRLTEPIYQPHLLYDAYDVHKHVKEHCTMEIPNFPLISALV